MKSITVAISTAMLLGSSVAQREPQSGGSATSHVPVRVYETALSSIPIESQVPSLLNHEMDSCHKRDTRPKDGANYPCVSQAWIEYTCKANGTSQEHLTAQRDCMCGLGSSFFRDAVGCSSCKTGYALQGTAEHPFWVDFYERLNTSYCGARALELEGNFSFYYNKTDPKTGYPPAMGPPPNVVENKYGGFGVVAVKEYYPEAPERQGPGKFTPVSPNEKGVSDTNANAPISVDGLLAVPAVVLVRANGTDNVSAPLTSSVMSGGAVSTTLVRVTAWNTTAQTLTPTLTSGLAPTSILKPKLYGTDAEHPLVINGQVEAFTIYAGESCVVIFTGSSMYDFDFVCTTVEIKRGSVRRLTTQKQWDKVKQLPDASSIKDCEAELQANGITGELVSKDTVVPGNGNKLPTSDKIPISGDKTYSHGQGTDVSDDECPNDNVSTPGNKTLGGESGSKTPVDGSRNKTPTNHSGNESGNKAHEGKTSDKTPVTESGDTSPVAGDKTPVGSGEIPVAEPGSGSGKTALGDQTESDACAEQARIQRSCGKSRDCICKEPFFKVAITCAQQKGLVCAQAEYWTQFYLDLQQNFCEKKALGGDFDAALNSQTSAWDETRNPERRKQFG